MTFLGCEHKEATHKAELTKEHCFPTSRIHGGASMLRISTAETRPVTADTAACRIQGAQLRARNSPGILPASNTSKSERGARPALCGSTATDVRRSHGSPARLRRNTAGVGPLHEYQARAKGRAPAMPARGSGSSGGASATTAGRAGPQHRQT